MAIFDRINRDIRKDALIFAACGLQRPWSMHSGYRSPRYTRYWEGLATTKAL